MSKFINSEIIRRLQANLIDIGLQAKALMFIADVAKDNDEVLDSSKELNQILSPIIDSALDINEALFQAKKTIDKLSEKNHG